MKTQARIPVRVAHWNSAKRIAIIALVITGTAYSQTAQEGAAQKMRKKGELPGPAQASACESLVHF